MPAPMPARTVTPRKLVPIRLPLMNCAITGKAAMMAM